MGDDGGGEKGGSAVKGEGGKPLGDDGAGVAGVKHGCEEEGGEGGDNAVGVEGELIEGGKARRGACDGGEVWMIIEVGGGNVDQITCGDSAMVWGLSWGL